MDYENSLEAIEAALQAGINFFDTAEVYGMGHSEKLLGWAMKGRRKEFIVASKIGWVGYDHDAGKSRYDSTEKLIVGVESNLERLGTDYLVVIQCHIDFQEPNLEYFLKGFQALQEGGKSPRLRREHQRF